MANRFSHEQQQPVDEVTVEVGLLGDGAADFVAQGGGDALVGVEDENPFPAERKVLQSPVLLRSVPPPLELHYRRSALTRKLLCPVAAPRIDDEDRAELRGVFYGVADVGRLVEGGDHHLDDRLCSRAIGGGHERRSASSCCASRSFSADQPLRSSFIFSPIQYSYIEMSTE